MSARQAVVVVWLYVIAKVFGCAALLFALGAPSWALAAWLLLHVRINWRGSSRLERR